MTRAEAVTALNRSTAQRARASARATARNRAAPPRLGKYAVPDDAIEAMSAMRERGKSYGQIGMRFGLSVSGARNRLKRRGGPA